MAAQMAKQDKLADYELKFIDKGAYGAVYKAIRRTDSRVFALKQVNLSEYKTRVELAMAIDEARMLSQLNHPHVIRYYDSFIDAENRLNILMEYATKGSLKTLIRTYKGRPMPEDVVWRVMVQSLLGLQYLHSKKIIHRDIKSANLFIDANDNIKIGDLGIARTLSASSNLAHTQLGTPYYLAPELCEDKPYNTKSDIWSLGVVLYECCMGCYPFDVDNNNTAALIRKIIRGQFKPIQGPYTSALVQLATSCLTFKPENRPETTQLLRNPVLISKAKVLNIDLNPRPAPPIDDRVPSQQATPSALLPAPPQPGPNAHPFSSPGAAPPAGAYASPQQQPPQYQPQPSPNSPYQQAQAAYPQYQRPGAPGRSPAAGPSPANHPFALAGPTHASPDPKQGYASPAGVAYGQAARPAPPPYAVQTPSRNNGWVDGLAADVNKMQLRENESPRMNAERAQQAHPGVHPGRQDHAKDVIYAGAQDSGPKAQRMAPEALPAAGKRPTSAHMGAPFATNYGAAGFQTQAHASMTEAWAATYQPPQYGRRRNPELQITGPSLRSAAPRGGAGRAGYVPAADDATTYVSTTYYTNR